MAKRPKDGYIMLAALSEWELPTGGRGKPATQKQRCVAVIVDSINFAVGVEYEDGKIIPSQYTDKLERLPFLARSMNSRLSVPEYVARLSAGLSGLGETVPPLSGNVDADVAAISQAVGGHLLDEGNLATRLLNK